MTSTLKTNAIEPEGATTNLVIGESGQNTVISNNDLRANVLQDAGDERVRAFTTVGANTWTCPTGITEVEVLIVAGGGGGGGRYYAGGGGAGGVVHDTDYTVVAGVTYDITVGAAGAGGAQDNNGGNGSNSVWNVNAEGSGIAMTAVGGGGGSTANGTAGATGSGGGGAGGWSGTDGGAAGQPAVSGATVYATAGGDGTADDAAGGGGAGGAGPDPTGGVGGVGGVGREFTSFGAHGTNSSNSTSPATGKGYFGGGGGGNGGPSGLGGNGGVGGGGAGATYGSGSGTGVDPVAGSANTGGGGGGAAHSATNGGTVGAAGGSGVVLIKYNADSPNAIFTSNGSGVLSGVNAGFGSAMALLSSQTASNSASITFSSGITSSFGEYIFKFYDVNPATDDMEFTFQVNAVGASGYDETITSSYFYSLHDEANSQTGLTYGTADDQAQGTAFQAIADALGNGSDESCAGELHLFNPSNTTYVTQFYSRVQMYHGGNMSVDRYAAGYINITAAIDEIQFKMTSGNFDGKIKMFGVN